MSRRFNIFLVLITLGLASWAYYLYQNSGGGELANLIKKEGEADYSGHKMETTVYDEHGKPQYFAAADEIKRYDNSERTEFFRPLLELFNKENSRKQWRVMADRAEITKDKMLYLRGNVKIASLDPSSHLQHIETDQIDVNLSTQDIFTESAVKSTGLGFTSSGIGLTGNLKKQVATLTKDVKTYIEPTVIQTNSGKSEQNKD